MASVRFPDAVEVIATKRETPRGAIRTVITKATEVDDSLHWTDIADLGSTREGIERNVYSITVIKRYVKVGPVFEFERWVRALIFGLGYQRRR